MTRKSMADESACSFHEVKALVAEGHYNMVSVRLSKCGGFRRSLRIIDFLRSEGSLTRSLANSVNRAFFLLRVEPEPASAEMLFTTTALMIDFLLKENVTKQNVSFGRGGQAGPLGGVGLGVEVSGSNLKRLSCGLDPVSFRRP